jgi:hypothetical protein
MAKRSEFEEKKILIEKQNEQMREKHEMKMKELRYQRESDLLKHNLDLERQRIKSAEIRKMQERKEWYKNG